MNLLSNRARGMLFTVFLGTCSLFLFHRTVLLSPNSHMAAVGGDGLKNYFSYAWHVEHDTATTVFSGMNAPFGEHINYPDAQPLLSSLHRAIDGVWRTSDRYSVGVVNLLMLFSLPLCALFLYLILQRSGLPWGLAAVAAVALAMITVQSLRSVQAHYALSYTWSIPLVIWSGLRHWQHGRPWASGVTIALILLGLLLVHVYLGFIGSVLLLGWALVGLFSAAPRSIKLSLLLAPILALSTFQALTSLTDDHLHRTEHPTGYFKYQVGQRTLLLPDHQWMAPLASIIPGAPAHEEPENWAYLGLGTLMMAVVMVGAFMLLTVVRKGKDLRVLFGEHLDPRGIGGLLLISIAFLLIAMGHPFHDGREAWLWDVPVFRQFRAPSRFAWVFLVGLGLFVVHALWRLTQLGGAFRWIAWAGLVGGVGLQLYEGAYLQAFIGREFRKSPNLFRYDLLSPEQRNLVDRARERDAVGIASIPYFHNGAEELMVQAHEPGLLLGQMMAYHTGLPMMSSSLTRTGLEEVRAGIAAFGPTWYARPALPYWSPSDSLLVIAHDDANSTYDRAVWERARPFHREGPVQLGMLAVGDLLRDDRQLKRSEVIASLDTAHRMGDRYFSTPDTFLYHDDFERSATGIHYHGLGAFAGPRNTFNRLAVFPPYTFDSAATYMASFWYYNRGPMRCHALAGVDEFVVAEDRGYWDHYTDPRFARTLDGDWSLIEIPFRVRHPEDRITLFVQGEPYYRDSIFVDELLVRKADVDVVRDERPTGPIWWNGHRLP
jgi:hypothetical protein